MHFRHLNKYKKEHSKNWASILGSDDFDIVEEVHTFEPAQEYMQEPD